jgi:hypothetical protein
MPINPEIALGVKQFEMPDPLTAYAKVAAIKDAQSRNALSQLEFAKARREETATNALNQAFQAGFTKDGLDYDLIKNSLAMSGQGSAIPAIEESQNKAKKSKFDLAESEGKAVTQRIALSQDLLSRIDPNDPDAPALLKQWHYSNHADPILGGWLKSQNITPGSANAKIDAAAAQGPTGIAQFQAQALQNSEAARKRIEEQSKPTDFERTLIASGYAKGSPEYVRLMKQKATLDSTRAPTEAGQLPADARTVNWLMTQPKDVQAMYLQMFGKGDTGKITHVITDNAGNVRMFTASGEEVTPKTAAGAPPPKGKPSATFEKTTAQRKQMGLDLDRAITELSAAAKNGGLIDQSTGSGLGQLADTAAGVIGKATPGAIAISKLQPIADMVLKMVPRFEGPQSDKDTQSYKEAAGQLANASLPNAIRKAAAQEIVRLMTARKGQFVSPAMADEGTPAQETTSAPTGNAPTQQVRDAADAIISGGK